MNNLTKKKRPVWVNWALFTTTVIVVFFLGLLASSIMDRRAETKLMNKKLVQIAENEPVSAKWGKNYPDEYETWLKTSDTTFRSKHMGSVWIDMLEQDPQMVILWAGYAFSKDYSQSRGHMHMITDIYNTLRTGAPKNENDGPQPATCWTCKSSDVPRLIKSMGADAFYKGKWASLGKQALNPVGCADCHNPQDMELRITRPALIEAFQRQGRDVIKNRPSRQEMRSLVCAQCHVEYYFKDKYYLTFPWDKGFSVEEMEKYYDETQFTDWTHALSKAPMLKAQHPDYELFLKGIHAQRGLACADCHMPYMSQGGIKFSSHYIVSPLKYISSTCLVCHRESEEELMKNVYERQDKVIEARLLLEQLLVKAHIEAKAAWESGATDEMMKTTLQLIRQAQWRWDFCAASHGGSFHAPIEMLRILTHGIEKAQEARIALAKTLAQLNVKNAIAYPDISTKEKAQAYIGLDMNKLKAEKQEFLTTLVPQWIASGKNQKLP